MLVTGSFRHLYVYNKYIGSCFSMFFFMCFLYSSVCVWVCKVRAGVHPCQSQYTYHQDSSKYQESPNILGT